MDALKSRERLLGPALRAQPDRRLVALARDGGEPAQEEIVRRYRAALVRYAGGIVGAGAAEDVVQEALAKGIGALARADEDLRLRPWLYAIVRNTALNHLRDAAPVTEQLDENYDGVEQPPQALERREGVRSLVGGLRRLPPQQREAIVKRELEGRSHDEIGAELGVSTGAARQLIFRARESLRLGFGSLLPMPLLRWLAESGGGDGAIGVAAGAGGGALAAKAAVAVFAAGAAVTAGVAIDHGAQQRAAADAAVRPAIVAPAGSRAAVPPEPAAATPGSGRLEEATAGDSGPGGGRSSGHGRGGDDGGGQSDGSGPGSGVSGGGDFDGGSGGERSGPSGPGRSGGDDSGSSHSGSSGGGSEEGGSRHGGNDEGGSRQGGSRQGGGESSSSHGGSGSSGGGGSGSGGSSGGGDSGHGGSGSGSGSSSSGDGSSSSDSSGGGSDDVVSPSPATAPSTSGPSTPVEESASEGSSGGDSSGSSGGSSGSSSESLRDLSGGGVSQGSDDPN